MVAGHLTEKNGHYHIVLNYKDEYGKRKTKWISTGLLAKKGNKRKAEDALLEARANFVPETKKVSDSHILFSDYMLKWLEIVKPTVAPTTYSSYARQVNTKIVPYFKKTGITLKDLSAADIQEFYLEQLKTVKAQTVVKYHANIHKALKTAVKMDLIDFNPADKVDRPKVETYRASYYSAEEINQLLEVSKGTTLELPILLASVYGLRRSEVLGLKWSAIDFTKGTITIDHTVTFCEMDGRKNLIRADTTKTKSSRRTLPLVPMVATRLLEKQKEIKRNERLCGNCYNKEFKEYICVDDLGKLIHPQYVTCTFPKLLQANNMRRIRFHDLRHSCASILLANEVPMKMIQEWLGHSDFSTTANIYSHLDYSSKLTSADAIVNAIGIVG